MSLLPTNSRAFCGEPSERSERPERKRGRQVRCNAMLGSPPLIQPYVQRQELPCDRQKFFGWERPESHRLDFDLRGTETQPMPTG